MITVKSIAAWETDEYSKSIVESINIFTLLKSDLISGLIHITSANRGIKNLAFRTLYIDINSFIDELSIFERTVYKVGPANFKCVDNFLLLTFELRKFLKRYKKQIKLFRNSVYAHNFRDKKNNFIDPLQLLIMSHKDAPVFYSEIKSMAEMCVLIVDIAKEQFRFNEDASYSHMLTMTDKFRMEAANIEAKKNIVPNDFLDRFQKDVFEKKDFHKGHIENYKILSKKLGCKILQFSK